MPCNVVSWSIIIKSSSKAPQEVPSPLNSPLVQTWDIIKARKSRDGRAAPQDSSRAQPDFWLLGQRKSEQVHAHPLASPEQLPGLMIQKGQRKCQQVWGVYADFSPWLPMSDISDMNLVSQAPNWMLNFSSPLWDIKIQSSLPLLSIPEPFTVYFYFESRSFKLLGII